MKLSLTALIEKCKDEPAVVVGVVVSVLALVGVKVTQPAAGVATQLLTALAPLLGALVTRHHVVPARKAVKA